MAESETQASGSRSSLIVWFCIVVIIGGVVVGYNYLLFRNEVVKKERNLAPFSQLPEFSFTDQKGASVSLKDLRGSFWVANFIFTRCPGPCIELTQEAMRLQEVLPKEVKMVSFTVDPKFDSPEVLDRFAQAHNADYPRWRFVTGPFELMKRLIVKGFKQVLADAPEAAQATEGLYIHSRSFALVDDKGWIRKYYDGLNPDATKQMQDDLEFLLANRAKP